MRHRLGSLVVALAAFTVAVAHAAPASVKSHKPSKSIGAPNHGRLEGGVHLESGPHLRVVGAYAVGDARFGVRELVEAIDHAAREVRKRFPDAVLGVGHLSHKDGGEIERHHSHESGRDADLAFYLTDVAGRPVARDRFMTILPNGIAAADSHVRFDDGRNWALVSALVSDPKARVTHIFAVNYLRTRLLAYAARVGAPAALRAKVAEVMMQPHHALPHDDHFHVRVACPANSEQCIEWPISSTGKSKGPAALAKTKPPKQPKPPTKKLLRARSTGHPSVQPLAPATSAPPPAASIAPAPEPLPSGA
ncbi:MAG: penicillin-insensitive murein endopeptidase [Sandaracinaceae bacterium]|nr:penicillin-insensitive murein endopeptidase [Sandaracinaceae bacterium]